MGASEKREIPQGGEKKGSRWPLSATDPPAVSQTTQLHLLDALTGERAPFWPSQEQAGGHDAAEGLRAEVRTLSSCSAGDEAMTASSQATLSPAVLRARRGLPSPHITCQAAQASISQPSIFFDFFQLLQVQTQLLRKEPQQNMSVPEAHALGLLSEEGKHRSQNNARHGILNPQVGVSASLHPPLPTKYLTSLWSPGSPIN